MRSIDDYIDLACKNHGLSQNRLGYAVGKGHTAVTAWRTRRAWPADDTMVKLAELAGIPADEALLDLNIWRSGDSPAGPIYTEIAKKIRTKAASIAAAITASGFAMLSASEVKAATAWLLAAEHDANIQLLAVLGCILWKIPYLA